MNELVDNFVIYWRKYQETWTEEDWKFYNKFALLNKSFDKNVIMSNNNNNEIFMNKHANFNYINNLMKADIKQLNNSNSDSGSNKEKNEANKIEENLLSVKNLNMYNNLAFSKDNFFNLQEEEENFEGKNNIKKKNKNEEKDAFLLTDKNKIETTRIKNVNLIEGEFEEIELVKRNEISTESNESFIKGNAFNNNNNNYNDKSSNNRKDNKSKLIREIDKEIDMHFHSENNCNSHLYLRKAVKNEEAKNSNKDKKNKKCRMCVECSIY